MDRTEMLQRMHAVLDGVASSEERAALDRVLAQDPQARTQFAELQRLFGALDGMPRVEPPEGFVDDVMAALQRSKAKGASTHQPFAQSGVIGPTGSDIRVRAPSKPITARTPSGPMWGRQDMSKRGYWIIGGVAAAVLALFVGTSVDFPASGDKAAGTIVPAERVRNTQPSAADVKLVDPTRTPSPGVPLVDRQHQLGRGWEQQLGAAGNSNLGAAGKATWCAAGNSNLGVAGNSNWAPPATATSVRLATATSGTRAPSNLVPRATERPRATATSVRLATHWAPRATATSVRLASAQPQPRCGRTTWVPPATATWRAATATSARLATATSVRLATATWVPRATATRCGWQQHRSRGQRNRAAGNSNLGAAATATSVPQATATSVPRATATLARASRSSSNVTEVVQTAGP